MVAERITVVLRYVDILSARPAHAIDRVIAFPVSNVVHGHFEIAISELINEPSLSSSDSQTLRSARLRTSPTDLNGRSGVGLNREYWRRGTKSSIPPKIEYRSLVDSRGSSLKRSSTRRPRLIRSSAVERDNSSVASESPLENSWTALTPSPRGSGQDCLRSDRSQDAGGLTERVSNLDQALDDGVTATRPQKSARKLLGQSRRLDS